MLSGLLRRVQPEVRAELFAPGVEENRMHPPVPGARGERVETQVEEERCNGRHETARQIG
jgi:hypothetical protein